MKFYWKEVYLRMNKFLSLLLGLILVFSFSCASGKKSASQSEMKVSIEVSALVLVKKCGGTKTTSLVPESEQEGKAYKNGKFILENKKNNKSYNLFLNEEGSATIEVVPGEYNVFFIEKKEGQVAQPSPRCMEWKSNPDAELSVRKNGQKFVLNLVKNCNPCALFKP